MQEVGIEQRLFHRCRHNRNQDVHSEKKFERDRDKRWTAIGKMANNMILIQLELGDVKEKVSGCKERQDRVANLYEDHTILQELDKDDPTQNIMLQDMALRIHNRKR